VRLLPKYGYMQKTEAQNKADKSFIDATLKKQPNRRKASDQVIQSGFKLLYSDIKTAMYRFNQAWLIDSANTDVYWGFGGVYMVLGDKATARKQYMEGLAINPNNTHLLTDFGTYFMAQYYFRAQLDAKSAATQLDSAIIYMTQSYELDKKDQNTTYKLSICYFEKNDCTNAWKYHKECMALGGQPITKEYTTALKEKCKNAH